jgi:signal transduction histidine kinase/phage shock protein PspC (stress-responsive transcriptional regulator)
MGFVTPLRDDLGMGTSQPAPALDTRRGFLGTGIHRSSQRIVGGVAAGLADHLRVQRMVVRVGFVLLSVCGGAGLLAYAVLWLVVPPEPPGRSPLEGPAPGGAERDGRRDAGAALVVVGAMALLRGMGFWFSNTVAWAVVLAAAGVCLVWLRSDDRERARLSRIVGRAPEQLLDSVGEGRAGKLRLAAGVLLVAGGLAVFLAGTSLLRRPATTIPVLVTVAGLAVIFGPMGWRLAGQLAQERSERIRSQERAEMAAHLHDSVLQTLALIQRAEGSRDMVALARNQERELRAWLIGRQPPADDTLAGAIEKAAASVELALKVPVEVVTVGDAPLDERLRAVVEACREATVNAAKHSGAPQISIYVEVEPAAVTAYVRDQGSGFDPGGVAPDRRGIAESIRGRMQRAGGTATIVTERLGGTEVQLTMPRAV